MHVSNNHSRIVAAPADVAFSEIVALGTPRDRIWPARSFPFQRTPGAPDVGVTSERHGLIRALLASYQPMAPYEMMWRSTLSYIVGTHGFLVEATSPTSCRVEHRLDVKLAWWFSPIWRVWMRRIHDDVIERLFDRLEAECASERVAVGAHLSGVTLRSRAI